MKIVKELKEQYAYLWWWLLDQGMIVATLLVNTFMVFIFALVMTAFYFVMRWVKGH